MKQLNFYSIVTGLIFISILLLTFWIRIQGVDRIPDGQFTENDAYTYYWQSEIIDKQWILPDKDMHRWLPVGRDNRQLLPLYAYAIAYLHKMFPWVSRYQIQVYLPTLCFTLSVCIIILFLVRTNGLIFASIVGLLLATLPGSISRSAVGFGDRDAWCYMLGVLAITSYLHKEQLQPGKWRTITTIFCGVIVFLGGFSWEAFGVFVLILLFMELWKFCTTSTEQDFREHLIWCLMFVPGLYLISPAYRSGYGFSEHVAAFMILPALTVLVILAIKHLLVKYVKFFCPHPRKLAWTLTCLAIAVGAGYIYLQTSTFETTAFAFKESRLMQNVSELADPHFGYWIGRYGAIFLLGSLGLIVATFSLWKWKGVPLALSLLLFTITTFFRWPVSDVIGETSCNIFFLISLGLTGICFVIASLRKETAENEKVLLAMLAWFVVWVAFARGGKRYDFFIGLPLAFGTAWLLWLSPAYLIQKLKDAQIIYANRLNGKRVAATCAIVVLIPVLFWNPFGGHANRAVHAAARMKRPIPGKGDLTQAFEWIKETLPQNAVIAANWPHGTQLNALSNVKTIVDSDHFLPHWIHLYYRHVHCAQHTYEALTFLNTHNATHLMLTEREVISRSHAYSHIGSNTHDDRLFWFYKLLPVDTPIGDPYQIRPRSDSTPIAFVDIVSKTLPRLPGAHSHTEPDTQQIITVTVHLKTHENISRELSLNIGKNSIRTVSLGNSGIVLEFNTYAILQNAYYIPSLGWHSLAVKLFLRDKHNDIFVPIYPINENNENNENNVKVWKINYPSYIKTNPKYLVTEPTDIGTATMPIKILEQHQHNEGHSHEH